MKKDTAQQGTSSRRGLVRDWEALFEAFQDVIEWALDIAVKLSRDYTEDIEAIENVREFFRAWRDGRPSDVPVADVLLTIATILSAIEIDLGIDSVSLLAPLRSIMADPDSLTPPMFHLPGFAQPAAPTVRIRRPLRYRNAGPATSVHAA